ncbi:MAG: TauD/TfdA family dioxygenase [Candidatus Azotimanducaceae bacterium WSBS_2022_MAG_OTU7]
MRKIELQTLTVAGQQHYSEVFPLVYGAGFNAVALDDVTAWLNAEREGLLKLLAAHGAILFRGFPVADAMQFDAFIQAFALDNFAYSDSLSNAVRVNRTERVFTANEAPCTVPIFLHHEMAQTPVYPSRLFFFCEKAPLVDGETPLCRSDVLLTQLQQRAPEFVAACEELGVRYSNTMPAVDDPESGLGRSWRSTLGTDEKHKAEVKLAGLGYRWEWQADDSLRATTPVLPAVRKLNDGRKVFFNQLIAAFRGWKDERNDPRKSISFGDDSDIPVDAINVAIELADGLSFNLSWQTGDVALVDNFLVMHGRRPFEGERRVLASLIADDGSRLVA